MSDLIREVNEEIQELLIIKERVEPFLKGTPTLVEDAEGILGKVTAAVQAGKSLAGNENLAKVLAGLKVLVDQDTRQAVAPEVKDINPKFTIKDVIKKVGEDKAANSILSRVADMYAKTEVEKYSNMLQAMEQDPAKKEAFVKHLNKMRMAYSRLGGLLQK